EDLVAEPRLQLAPDVRGVVEAEHGRQADDLAGDEGPVQFGEHGFPEGGLLEPPGEAQWADVAGLAERWRNLDDSSRDGRAAGPHCSSKAVSEVGGDKALYAAEPREG